MLFLQVNDASVSLLVIIGSKVQLFYTQITEQIGRGMVEGCHPLTCCVGCRSTGQGPQLASLGDVSTEGTQQDRGVSCYVGWRSSGQGPLLFPWGMFPQRYKASQRGVTPLTCCVGWRSSGQGPQLASLGDLSTEGTHFTAKVREVSPLRLAVLADGHLVRVSNLLFGGICPQRVHSKSEGCRVTPPTCCVGWRSPGQGPQLAS